MTAECPTCGKVFEENTRSAKTLMRIHHSTVHGESLVDPGVCEYCGEEFDRSNHPEKVYCSKECFGLDNQKRVTRECPNCHEEFDVQQCHSDQVYCSRECWNEDTPDKYERRECEMCGRKYKARRVAPTKFCSQSCESEHKADRPRPDDVDMLLWLLYVYEGFSHGRTYERQRAVLGNDNRLTKPKVKERLKEMGVYNSARNYGPMLEEMDPDEFGTQSPEGDDSWKQYRGENHAD